MNFIPYLNLIRPSEYGDTQCFGDSPDPLEIVNDYPDAVLYVSDLTEFPLKRMGRVDKVWESLNDARSAANKEMNNDLSTSFISSLPARSFKSAIMGKPECTQFIRPATRVQTLPIPTYYLQGGELLIRSIGLQWSQAVDGQVVELYEKGSSVAMETFIINVKERSKQQIPLSKSWRIPMNGVEYELRTTIPDGVRVADNTISCCSNTPNLTTLIPRCYSGRAGGWMISISGSCNYEPLLVQLIDNEPTRKVLAYMLAYQTAYLMCNRIESGEINRGSVLSETDITTAAAACRTAYLSRLNWLVSELPNLPIDVSSTCFQKVPQNAWRRGGIIV